MKQQIEDLIDRLADGGCKTMRTIHVAIPISKALGLLKEGTNPLSCSPSEALVELTSERAKGKKYFCGCDNQKSDGSCAGHPHLDKDSKPILIGDVLEKYREVLVKSERPLRLPPEVYVKLLSLWSGFKFTKSLQEIYAEAEWEWVKKWNHSKDCPLWKGVELPCNCGECNNDEPEEIEVPKQPAIRDLFSFLLTLGL